MYLCSWTPRVNLPSVNLWFIKLSKDCEANSSKSHLLHTHPPLTLHQSTQSPCWSQLSVPWGGSPWYRHTFYTAEQEKKMLATRCYTRTRKLLLLCWKCHMSIINLCTKTTELEPCARLQSSQFPARFRLFRCRPVSSPPPGKWPSEKPFPRSAARNPVPRWRTCPPRSPSARWSSASSCPEGHYPKIRQYGCHADQAQTGMVTWR